jgi:DNA-binding response OmpR family regulator
VDAFVRLNGMSATPRDRPARLLVVDDEPKVLDLVRRYFESQGFAIDTAADGDAMRALIAEHPIDLVLLDLGLPGEDGFSLTRWLREHWGGAVIIVTGRGEAVDRVVGLELGADDYVTKPFELRELLARVRSVLRRAQAVAVPRGTTLDFDGYRLDLGSRALTDRDGAPVELTNGEFELLRALAERPQVVLSRDELMSRLHGREAGPYDRAIDVQIARLRRKIESDPARPQIIKSVRGAGYMLAARVERA